MNKNDLRTCCVCHSQYPYCPSCQKELPTWMLVYCSENCKNIYEATSGFEYGQIDAKTANNQLSKLDLSKKENFGESYQRTLKKISDEVKKSTIENEKNIENKKDIKINDNSNKLFVSHRKKDESKIGN